MGIFEEYFEHKNMLRFFITFTFVHNVEVVLVMDWNNYNIINTALMIR